MSYYWSHIAKQLLSILHVSIQINTPSFQLSLSSFETSDIKTAFYRLCKDSRIMTDTVFMLAIAIYTVQQERTAFRQTKIRQIFSSSTNLFSYRQIHQTFSRQNCIAVNSPKFPPAKLSSYTVINQPCSHKCSLYAC